MPRWLALAVVLSLAAAAGATWPAFSSPTDTILGNWIHPDCLGNHWLLVWIADQLATGGSVLHNDAYYWPVGDAPWLAGNGSEGFPYAPLHWLLGWPLASTVWLVGVLTLNGVAGFALARAAGASPPAALTAAPATTLLLFTVHELGAGRFTQVSVCWLVFFLAAWLRFLDSPTRPRALAAAALLAVTCFFYWYYGLFGVMAGGLLLAFRRAPVRRLAEFSVAFLVLVAPLLWVFLRYWSSIPGTGEDVFPHPEAVGDSTWPAVPFLVTGGRHAGLALPFTTCALAVVGLVRKEDRWKGLALGAVAVWFAALLAGPLIPNGPYEWVYGLAGPLRRFWWPYRHVVGLNVALIALAARGAEPLVRRFTWLGPVLALSIPLQLQAQGAPWHAQFTRVTLPDPFYEKVRALPGEVLVEPPLAPQTASAQTPLMYQLIHRKKLLAGHALWVDRVRPDAWDAFVAENSFLAEMQRLERGELAEGVFRFEAADLETLRDMGIGTFVLNREYFVISLKDLAEAYEKVFKGLFGKPAVTGKRALAWSIDGWTGATEVAFPTFAWPAEARPGGPTLAIQGMRYGSPVFSVPEGPTPKSPTPKKK